LVAVVVAVAVEAHDLLLFVSIILHLLAASKKDTACDCDAADGDEKAYTTMLSFFVTTTARKTIASRARKLVFRS
jgi:hypothetical protein